MATKHYLTMLVLAFATQFINGAESVLLDACDVLSLVRPKEKCTIELVDGKAGNALKLSFSDDCRNTFAYAKFKASPEWDSAAGISFMVKGDGSDRLGGIQLVWNNDFSIRYGFAFPINSTEWKKVIVPWRDFIPELCNANSMPLDPIDAKPSKITLIGFGKWWYWRDYAAHSYAIDDIRLEPTIEAPGADYKPQGPPLARVAAKLKAGQPVTIVTMGDSLTDFNHWANKPVNWPTLLKEKLRQKFNSETTLINPAIGGTELRQNLVLIPRWLSKAPEPDLVTICFGGNDWNSGMRGEMFLHAMQDAVDRVRLATRGKADVLLLTTCPGVEKWETYLELADAARKAASAMNSGLADIYRAFHDAGKSDKEALYCKDKVHLGPAGHDLFSTTVLKVLENAAQ